MTLDAAVDLQDWFAKAPWNLLLDVWNWFADLRWDWVIAFGLGVLATAFADVLKRRAAAGFDWVLDWIATRFRTRFKANADKRRQQRAAAEAAQAAAEESQALARLHEERVGRWFRHRLTARDPGLIGEVTGLYARQPKSSVMVRWESPPERTPTPYDDGNLGESSIEWRQLRCPTNEQRRRTAHYKPQLPGDEDGWVEYEEIDGPPASTNS